MTMYFFSMAVTSRAHQVWTPGVIFDQSQPVAEYQRVEVVHTCSDLGNRQCSCSTKLHLQIIHIHALEVAFLE